jgi:hypothetical protein
VTALEGLRLIRMMELKKLLDARLAQAKKTEDLKGTEELGKEEELWYSFTNEIMLPSFLRTPPPIFALKAVDQPIRVLAFGDFGTGSPAQVSVAKAMGEYHKLHAFDFGLTLGDNFYSRVQFFAFDTVEINEAELQWLDSELARSTAPWKAVYGHYHIYSATRRDNKILIERLLPILKEASR